MKRWITIISCLLCLSCILALCSCSCGKNDNDDGNVTPTGTNAELDALHNNLANAGASRATAKVTYTFVGDTEDDNSDLKATIVINDESLGEEDSLDMPYFVPVTAAGGKVTLSPSKTASVRAAGEAGSKLKAVDFAKFSFDRGNFKNGEYSYANNIVFKATVTNADAFFGTALELPPAGVEVTITLRPSGQPKDMKVAYTTESGNAVSIQVTYGYN